MKKRRKIKRYGSIYGRGPGAPLLMVVAMVVGIGILAVIGWSLYTPIHNLIMSIGQEASASSLPPPASRVPDENASAAPEPTAPSLPANSSFAGVYVPATAVRDLAAFDALLATAKEAGLTAVMIDAKDASGAVLYRSENASATAARAVAEPAYDAAAIAKRISAAGLTPIARIHAFRDNLVSRVDRSMAVSYYNTGTNWLDNSPDLGGKAWLNPYSTEARGYITALAVELTQLGFEQIVVDSVQFPSGVALDKAGYGANAVGVSRAQVLKSFAGELEQAVEAAGGQAMLYYPTAGIVGENQMIYGGNAAALATKRTVLGILPTALPNGLTLGETTIARPADDFASTVTAVLEHAKAVAPAGTQFVAMIQAYVADGTPLPAGELLRQSEAAKAAGAGYLYYNPQGSYNLN